MSTIWVDLYEVTSVADVAVRFDLALSTTPGPLARALRTVAVGLSVNPGVLSVQLTRPARDRPDPSVALGNLLQVLVGTATRHPVLLVVDEWSSISRVRPAAGALRTALQHHFRDLGIVFSGSEPSTMRMLFGDRPEPFYAQADLVEIGPLDAGEVDQLVEDGFASTGRGGGALAQRLHLFAAGHPQRTMQLADAAWRRAERSVVWSPATPMTPGGQPCSTSPSPTTSARTWPGGMPSPRR